MCGVVYGQTIDYSFAGYKSSEYLLPVLLEEDYSLLLKPNGKDDTQQIQAAIDLVSMQSINKEGYRGIIRLSEGSFNISHSLYIKASGIILTGCGEGTRLCIHSQDRMPLFIIKGEKGVFKSCAKVMKDTEIGSSVVYVDNVELFDIGQNVTLMRPSTLKWIHDLGTNRALGNFAPERIHWKEGQRNVFWDRKIVSISKSAKRLILDAPLTLPLEKQYGGGYIAPSMIKPVCEIGIQNMSLISGDKFESLTDENHAWIGIWMDNVEDVWIRNVSFAHFCGSAIRTGNHARKITIVDCSVAQPICENMGYRKQAFYIEGQQTLVRNCISIKGKNDYVVGLCAGDQMSF